jgi:hypothetical protein
LTRVKNSRSDSSLPTLLWPSEKRTIACRKLLFSSFAACSAEPPMFVPDSSVSTKSCISASLRAFSSSLTPSGSLTSFRSGLRNATRRSVEGGAEPAFRSWISFSSRTGPKRYMRRSVLARTRSMKGVCSLLRASSFDVWNAITLSWRVASVAGSCPVSGRSSIVLMLPETSNRNSTFGWLTLSSKVWQPGSRKTSARIV